MFGTKTSVTKISATELSLNDISLRNGILRFSLGLAALALAACSSSSKNSKSASQANAAAASATTSTTATSPGARTAEAALTMAPNVKATGRVSLEETDKGLKVVAEIKGLKPGAVHALHIHENGKCDGPKFTSAGGHFNPNGSPHGAPTAETKHLGDFGNVVANKDGVARKEILVMNANLEGASGVMGKAIVLHSKADDLVSQPSGDAGDRIGCGIIQTAQSAASQAAADQ